MEIAKLSIKLGNQTINLKKSEIVEHEELTNTDTATLLKLCTKKLSIGDKSVPNRQFVKVKYYPYNETFKTKKNTKLCELRTVDELEIVGIADRPLPFEMKTSSLTMNETNTVLTKLDTDHLMRLEINGNLPPEETPGITSKNLANLRHFIFYGYHETFEQLHLPQLSKVTVGLLDDNCWNFLTKFTDLQVEVKSMTKLNKIKKTKFRTLKLGVTPYSQLVKIVNSPSKILELHNFINDYDGGQCKLRCNELSVDNTCLDLLKLIEDKVIDSDEVRKLTLNNADSLIEQINYRNSFRNLRSVTIISDQTYTVDYLFDIFQVNIFEYSNNNSITTLVMQLH